MFKMHIKLHAEHFAYETLLHAGDTDFTHMDKHNTSALTDTLNY